MIRLCVLALLGAYMVCWFTGIVHWLVLEAFLAAIVVAVAETGESNVSR